nr:hypothetical protein [Leptospira noguchii]
MEDQQETKSHFKRIKI